MNAFNLSCMLPAGQGVGAHDGGLRTMPLLLLLLKVAGRANNAQRLSGQAGGCEAAAQAKLQRADAHP